ncbi:MAG: hypothetical protein ACFBSD_15900 [Paracoccaceae bacterium]
MARFELRAFKGSVIRPLLPRTVRGQERANDRRVPNGIFWRVRMGAVGGHPGAVRAAYDPREPL